MVRFRFTVAVDRSSKGAKLTGRAAASTWSPDDLQGGQGRPRILVSALVEGLSVEGGLAGRPGLDEHVVAVARRQLERLGFPDRLTGLPSSAMTVEPAACRAALYQMSAPMLASRHSCVSPGRIVMVGRTRPLTTRVVGASLSMFSAGMAPSLCWKSLSEMVRSATPRRAAGRYLESPSTMITPDMPPKICDSTSPCMCG